MNGNNSSSGSGPGTMMGDEPGSTDNRLTLDPSAFGGFAQDWEDGQEYSMTVRVRQVSPGEFEVIDAKGSQADSEESGEPPMQGTEEETPAGENMDAKGRGTYPNPAVARMMSGPKR